MYSWIAGRAVRALIGRLNAGDVPALMRAYADDALLVFPGNSSFAGEMRGKREIEAWLERFVSLGPSLVVHDVAVAGAPWNLRVLFRFSDRIPIPDGGEYRNEGMEYLRIRFGKCREQFVSLDHQRAAPLAPRLKAAA